MTTEVSERTTPAGEFFRWRPAGVGRRRLPCAACGGDVACELLDNLLELLCPACGRNVALERARAVEAEVGAEGLAARLEAMGLGPGGEVGASSGSLLERLIDRGGLRRDLRLTLELDREGGWHAYGAAPLRAVVAPAEVEAALEVRRRQGGALTELLRRQVTDRLAATVRSVGSDVGIERLDPAALDPTCREALPPRALQVYRVAPVRREGEALVVAMWDPLDYELIADLEALGGRAVHAILAEPERLSAVLRAWGVPEGEGASEVSLLEAAGSEEEDDELWVGDDPLAGILLEALEEGASEVLLEPGGARASLRYRVDGELRKERAVPGELPVAVAAALEQRSGAGARGAAGALGALRVGSARCELSGLPVQLEYRSIETPLGPSVALTLEGDPPSALSLGRLGLDLEGLAAFEALLAERRGIVVLAAPRASERSEAYLACLERAVRLGGSVVSLERAVRRVIPGTTQLDLDPALVGRLDAVLHPVPDWLGLDGVLDRHTLRLAVDVALSGGAVLLTLPAPDGARALDRLTLEGLPPGLVRGGVRAVLARRVVPRSCPHCRVEREVRTGGPEPLRTSWIGLGCAACADQGTEGTLPLAELLEPDPSGLVPCAGTRRLTDLGADLVARGEVRVEALGDLFERRSR